MQLEMVELLDWQTTNLGVTRILIKHVRKKLGSYCNTCNDQTMNVIAVHDKKLMSTTVSPVTIIIELAVVGPLSNAVKVHKKRDENFIGSRAILENAN